MNSLLRRLKSAFPFVGERAATENDLFEFCADHKIEIVFTPETSAGIYVMFNRENFIFLNSRLTGRRLLHVAFHEIGHYLLHVPKRRQFAAEFYGRHENERTHCEAETVAALLLLPMPDLEDLLIAGVHKHDDELAELIGRRLDFASQHSF